MTDRPSRRRFLTVAGALAGLSLVPAALAQAAAAAALHRWQGVVLGAEARIVLHHPAGAEARRLIESCVAEIARLERIFSLHRADSALSRLNRAGTLEAPPFELVQLLGDCRRFGRLTGGAFDATVQPLWRLHADHFARGNADPSGPPPSALARARALVDYEAVSLDSARVALVRPGMAVTLNGIAQGFITDRVAALLRAGGIERVLLDLGEVRALGHHPSGRPWRVGLRDPRWPGRSAATVELADRAIATSAPAATRFDASGDHHHLFEPGTGRPTRRALGASVIARDATTADALSTAFCVMPEPAIRRVVATTAGISARLLRRTGETIRYPA